MKKEKCGKEMKVGQDTLVCELPKGHKGEHYNRGVKFITYDGDYDWWEHIMDKGERRVKG